MGKTAPIEWDWPPKRRKRPQVEVLDPLDLAEEPPRLHVRERYTILDQARQRRRLPLMARLLFGGLLLIFSVLAGIAFALLLSFIVAVILRLWQ